VKTSCKDAIRWAIVPEVKMATGLRAPDEQQFVLYDVPWNRYTRLLRALEDRHVRLTYDQGTLELMSLSYEHERCSHLLGRFVDTLTEELNIAVQGGGSTTFRRRARRRGLEPDRCYWIANEPRVRGKDKIDLRRDPPPDLAIEVEISRSALDRLAIYASLGVPEVWRYDGRWLQVHVLGADGKYEVSQQSLNFPLLPLKAVSLFLQRRKRMDETSLIRSFRAWVREQIARGWPAA
jgi:Uma2 family endonuclease